MCRELETLQLLGLEIYGLIQKIKFTDSHIQTVKTMQGASAALNFLVCTWSFCEICRIFSKRTYIVGKHRLLSLNTSLLPSLAAFSLSTESESMQPLVGLIHTKYSKVVLNSQHFFCLKTLKCWGFMHALASMTVVKWAKCVSRLCLSSLKYFKTVPWHLWFMWYP